MADEKHFILVHGACHGAWTWYKLKPLLEAAGHRVTALDMAASGININTIDHIHSLRHYSEPLLQTLSSLPPNQKAILVGHSLGGLNLALAMDTFPHKISVSVFLTAFVPDTTHKPSYVLEQGYSLLFFLCKYCENTPMEAWLDTEFSPYGNAAAPSTSMLFGPKFMSCKLYHLSPTEDLELAKTLLRPSSLFMEDLSKAEKFSLEKYGSVAKVYVVCKEDKGIAEKFQEWMIANCGINNVIRIDGADHMPMFSKPRQLFECLNRVAHTFH